MERMGRKRRRRCMNNKGFSLVELIIVIAIMAILIGVMAPQLMKYVDRSRQSADTQVADTVRTAVVTAMMDPAVTDAPATKNYADLGTLFADTSIKDGHGDFVKAVRETLNITESTSAADAAKEIKDKLTSKAFNAQEIQVDIANSKVTVKIENKVDANLPLIID